MTSFAIVPAAGISRRMSRPKLLLPWQGRPILEWVLTAWQQSRVDHVVVVARPDDPDVVRIAQTAGGTVVVPSEPPAEMKVSVRLALDHLASHHGPSDDDVWLLAPADLPGLTAAAIDVVLDAATPHEGRIWIAAHAGHRGHPAAFPWSLADDVRRLGANEGVNSLLTRHLVRSVEVANPAILRDIDTPADYQRGLGQ